ncbi:MAG: hypothetical protein ACFFD2_00565 [Promethearchaeota archaeon]
MNQILRLLFKFNSEYSGDPRFISGNAFRHALSKHVNTSIGIFTDIDCLTIPQTYREFFFIRTKKCFVFPHFERFFDLNYNEERFRYFFTPHFVTFDILDPSSDLINTIRALEPLQLGGQRHSGYGVVTLHDFLYIDVNQIIMPEQATHLILVSPIIYRFPFIEKFDYRREKIQIWNHGKLNLVEVISHGQFFRLKPTQNIPKIAKNGIVRKIKANKTLFSQFGFGEFVLNNWKSGRN